MPVSDFVELSLNCLSEFPSYLCTDPTLDDQHLDLLARRLTKLADAEPLGEQRLVAAPRLARSQSSRFIAQHSPAVTVVRQARLYANLARLLAELDQHVAALRHPVE